MQERGPYAEGVESRAALPEADLADALDTGGFIGREAVIAGAAATTIEQTQAWAPRGSCLQRESGGCGSGMINQAPTDGARARMAKMFEYVEAFLASETQW